jgi:RNA recognition motif-containing protein
MSKKLYVGNLPWSVDNEKLKELFSAYNPEAAEVISYKDTGKSKGYGFVTLPDENAEKAIQEMNDKEVEGRKLKVNEATPFDPTKQRERRPFRSSGFRREGGFGGRSGGFRRDSEGGFGGGRGFRRDDRD